MKSWDSLHAFCQNAWEWEQKKSCKDTNKLMYFEAKIFIPWYADPRRDAEWYEKR